MKPIALYASEGTLKKTAIFGGVFLFLAYQAVTWTSGNGGPLAQVLGISGLAMICQAAWQRFNPKPSFEADWDGFRVMGKEKLGWDDFRGVTVHTAHMGLFPIAQWVVVKKGKTMLEGRIYIKATHLSGPAKEMVADIAEYAQAAKRITAMASAEAVLAAADATRHRFPPNVAPTTDANDTHRPVRPAADFMQPVAEPVFEKRGSFAERLSAAGLGPVEAVPSMGERIFGRRKVV